MKRIMKIILLLLVLLVTGVPVIAEEELPSSFQVYFSGTDSRDEEAGNSDANVIITVNTDSKQILLVHIPRDYYIEVAGTDGSKDKLADCGTQGIDVVLDSVNALMNMDIQFYVRFDFQGLVEFIDAMGGIDVYSEYTFDSGNQEGFHYHRGMNHLDGTSALAYARERYAYGTGDRQRGRNQMWLMKAVIDAFSSGSMLERFQSFIDSTKDCYETNIPLSYIVDMLLVQIDEHPEWELITYSVNGSDITVNGNYAMEPDMDTVEEAGELMQIVLNDETLTCREYDVFTSE